jgi:hypothetical protein
MELQEQQKQFLAHQHFLAQQHQHFLAHQHPLAQQSSHNAHNWEIEQISDIEEILNFLSNSILSGEEGADINLLADDHEETIDTQLEGVQKAIMEEQDIGEIINFLSDNLLSGEEGAFLNQLADDHEETIDTQLEGLQSALLEEARMIQKEKDLQASIQELIEQIQKKKEEEEKKKQTQRELDKYQNQKDDAPEGNSDSDSDWSDDESELYDDLGNWGDQDEEKQEEKQETSSAKQEEKQETSSAKQEEKQETSWAKQEEEETSWAKQEEEEEVTQHQAKKAEVARQNWKKAILFSKVLCVLKQAFIKKTSEWSDVQDVAQKSTKKHLRILDLKKKHKVEMEEWLQKYGEYEGETSEDWLYRLSQEHGKYRSLCRHFSTNGTCIHENAHGPGSCDFLHVPPKPKELNTTKKVTQQKPKKNTKKKTARNKSANSYSGLYDSDSD